MGIEKKEEKASDSLHCVPAVKKKVSVGVKSDNECSTCFLPDRERRQLFAGDLAGKKRSKKLGGLPSLVTLIRARHVTGDAMILPCERKKLFTSY